VDELAMMIQAGRALARLGFKDEEIEAVKRYCRETPTRGLTAAQTMLQAAEFLAQRPDAKAVLLETCAKPLEVRNAEAKLLHNVIPHIQAAGKLWPSEEAEAELKARIVEAIEIEYPTVPMEQRSEAFHAAWSVSPRTGWSFDARKAIAILLRPCSTEAIR
jgi:hypothetical protein